jgi:hypothetical protein
MPKATNNVVNWPPKEKGWKPAPRPTSVKIGFYELAILWVSGDEWIKKYNPELMGQFDANQGYILMRLHDANGNNLSEQILRETLWHEMLHGCWWHMGLSDHPVMQGEEQEEEIIKRITHASLQAIQDNPEVMAYLSSLLFATKVAR